MSPTLLDALKKYLFLVSLGMESAEFKSSMPDRESYYASKESKYREVKGFD